jgi:hypothetical protein
MRRSLMLIVPSLALGCVGATESENDLAMAPQDASVRLDLTASVADLATSYPAGPYGHTVGSVFPLLAWSGYVDPAADQVATNELYGSYSSDDLRKSGAAYALLHVSEVD